jgi:hypothetical protein
MTIKLLYNTGCAWTGCDGVVQALRKQPDHPHQRHSSTPQLQQPHTSAHQQVLPLALVADHGSDLDVVATPVGTLQPHTV